MREVSTDLTIMEPLGDRLNGTVLKAKCVNCPGVVSKQVTCMFYLSVCRLGNRIVALKMADACNAKECVQRLKHEAATYGGCCRKRCATNTLASICHHAPNCRGTPFAAGGGDCRAGKQGLPR